MVNTRSQSFRESRSTVPPRFPCYVSVSQLFNGLLPLCVAPAALSFFSQLINVNVARRLFTNRKSGNFMPSERAARSSRRDGGRFGGRETAACLVSASLLYITFWKDRQVNGLRILRSRCCFWCAFFANNSINLFACTYGESAEFRLIPPPSIVVIIAEKSKYLT